MRLSAIYIGFDPRAAEAVAFGVTRRSLQRRLTQQIPVHGLVLSRLRDAGLYTRPHEIRMSEISVEAVMWDVISDAPMSTEFANSRFLVSHIARLASRVQFHAINERAPRYADRPAGWVMFLDGDMLVRTNVARLLEGRDLSKAVWCVKHIHNPPPGMKMDGQVQTNYSHKNWSSLFAINPDHPSNKKLTLEMVNTLPGRDLHRFCWLEDDEIGDLGVEWNWLVGHSDPDIDPKIVHFTDGPPSMPRYADVPYADEWRAELEAWAD